MGAVRSRLRRWHIWLGWIVGLPLLVWTVSGLLMVWKPIEEVRGSHLMAEPKPMRMAGVLVPPALAGVPLQSLTLEQRAAGPRWVIILPDGTTRLASPETGALLPPLSAADAAREVMALYSGKAKIRSVTRTSADAPPIELRRADRDVAGGDGRRHPFLRRCRLGRGGRQAHRLVAVLRFHVGPAHHGPGDPRGYAQPAG